LCAAVISKNKTLEKIKKEREKDRRKERKKEN
jgi:hypothetical protein